MTTMKHTVAAALTSVLAFGSSITMMGADWPSFRGPNHDGISAEAITWPKDGPKQLWKINVGIGHSAVSVVGDRAYTMGNANDTDTVFSIDVATGKVIWTHSYPCTRRSASRNTTDHSRRRLSPTVSFTRSVARGMFSLWMRRTAR